jgi:non-heme chloroperoxidase
VVAHDRRGDGRSEQTWTGDEYDTFADDLAELLEKLDLKEVTLVGHSMGGGKVARYIGRHGNKRVKKAVIIGGIPPVMLKSDKNPGGLPMSVFDGIRAALVADHSQFYKDISLPFYGYNKPDAKVSQGVRDSYWRQGMQSSIIATYECVKAFSETDFTEDLKKIEVPALVIHGDADQIVPISDSAELSSKIVKNATLKVIPGAPHGLCTTHADQINAPVKEPFSWPNSSEAISDWEIAAQFTRMKARFERLDRLCIARAISSFPVPVSPKIKTVESVGDEEGKNPVQVEPFDYLGAVRILLLNMCCFFTSSQNRWRR